MSAGARMRRIHHVIAVAMMSGGTLVSGACGKEAPPHPPIDVAGWYVRDIGDGREVIDVRPGGEYVHAVTIRGAAARADQAHWHAVGDSALVLGFYREAAEVGHGVPPRDSVRVALHPAPEGELRLVLPSDSATFLRRLRYGKQRGG